MRLCIFFQFSFSPNESSNVEPKYVFLCFVFKMPSHLEVSMEMDGDESVMWTGELKCVPSVPDLRPRPSAAAPPHRPKSVLYVNSVHIGTVTISYKQISG